MRSQTSLESLKQKHQILAGTIPDYLSDQKIHMIHEQRMWELYADYFSNCSVILLIIIIQTHKKSCGCYPIMFTSNTEM